MFKSSAWVLAGAVLATAGAAYAQETPAPLAPSAAYNSAQVGPAVPWYQRFTTSNGVTEAITGVAENDRSPPAAWSVNQRWGITLDVREADRVELAPEARRGDQTAVGAYYQFTPRVRVGGEVSLGAAQRQGAAPVTRAEEESAGVRVESAFRF